MARTKSTPWQVQSGTTGTGGELHQQPTGGFIAAAKKMRIWDREPKVRNIP